MIFIASNKIPKKTRIYHKENCIYAKRIKKDNQVCFNSKYNSNMKYCACKYCAGLQGDLRLNRKKLKHYENENFTLTYVKQSDTLFIRTNIGFWKIFQDPTSSKYLLYHLNRYYPKMKFNQLCRGQYHRQKDVKKTESIEKIIHYVAQHDKAKVIIKEDYTKLPRSSKKQKNYYAKAKRKNEKRQISKIYALFDQIESKNPTLKDASFC